MHPFAAMRDDRLRTHLWTDLCNMKRVFRNFRDSYTLLANSPTLRPTSAGSCLRSSFIFLHELLVLQRLSVVLFFFPLIQSAFSVLDYIALFLFWKELFKKNWIAFSGAVLFIFSPFIWIFVVRFYNTKKRKKRKARRIVVQNARI